MGRNSPVTRTLVRLRGGRSEDDRDVARALRRALKRAGRREGGPQPVQGAGQPLSAEDYGGWRTRALRRGAVSSAPELEPGRYALVLFTFALPAAEQFVRHGAAAHLAPPTVGMFRPETEPAVALAGTLAAWIELYDRPVSLAPPLLHTGGRWRAVELGLEWPLPPYRGRER